MAAFYGGLSGLEMGEEEYPLAQGVILRRTYAHVMAPFLLAANRPVSPGAHHPGPWRSVTGGFFADVTSELEISPWGTHTAESILKSTLLLIRLAVNPAVIAPVTSDRPFASLTFAGELPLTLNAREISPRHFPLGVKDAVFNQHRASWVAEHLTTVLELLSTSSEFSFAVEAFMAGQFQEHTALILVSLWGSLESLFSPSTSELRFRVSALIASYLEAPGQERLQLQRLVAKLYDKRSAAAHGKPKHEENDVLETYWLLARVLRRIIETGTVPNKETLEAQLFGAL